MLFIHDTNVFIVPCIFGVLCWAMGTFKRSRRKVRGREGDREEQKRRQRIKKKREEELREGKKRR